MKTKYSTKDIVLTGLGMALVFISTLYIQIPNATQGYFNLGDGFILLFASIVDPVYAFLIGGLGSALADVAGGYAYYFIPTLLTKGLEGIVVSYLFKKYSKKIQLPAYFLGGCIMVFGYFLAKIYLTGSIPTAFTEVPGNIFQGLAGIIIAYICYPIIFKLKID